jgi:small-conductance mechanosensitive channel
MTAADIQLFFPDLVIDILHIGLIFLIGKIILRGITAAVIVSIASSKDSDGFRERVLMIKGVIHAVGNTVIYGVTLFLILAAIGINILPILAGAGVLGLVAGLGAQTLVKDFFSGLLISAEDQYRVGEKVKINAQVEGTVVRIAMRLTTLRGDEGEIHHILNSSITTVTNFTRKEKVKRS